MGHVSNDDNAARRRAGPAQQVAGFAGPGLVSDIACIDIGSTWTKGARVSEAGTLLAVASSPTTTPEVRHGIDEVRRRIGTTTTSAIGCSSASGGLRLVVVGQERLVSVEAGRRAALTAGAKVVGVFAGALDDHGVGDLLSVRADIVLLTGGTDGGDTDVLLHNAMRIAASPMSAPVVLAGNAEVAGRAASMLVEGGKTVTVVPNVLPDIGELATDGARAAIRESFLRHVIGTKGLSSWEGFRSMVRTVTPDAVLTAVPRLAALATARGLPGAVAVVDVGGATTDVYSSVARDSEYHNVEPGGEGAVGLAADLRTVEGDLGVRFSAPDVVEQAYAERLIDAAETARLAPAAAARAERVHDVPENSEQSDVDATIGRLAVTLAMRRHLRLVGGRFGRAGIGALVLSGGVLRHAGSGRIAAVERALVADPVLRPLLRESRMVVDTRYVLAPAGLLVGRGDCAAADVLLSEQLSFSV